MRLRSAVGAGVLVLIAVAPAAAHVIPQPAYLTPGEHTTIAFAARTVGMALEGQGNAKIDTQLVSVRDGIVRLKLHGTCGSCPSSSLTLKNAVEEALYEAAPDILEIVAENAAVEPAAASNLVVLK
jgi:urease alpha subunit